MAADVSQLFWIELADKMRTFRYDPSRRFRGWLRRCFHWRAVDAIRERSREERAVLSLEDLSATQFEGSILACEPLDDEDDESGDCCCCWLSRNRFRPRSVRRSNRNRGRCSGISRSTDGPRDETADALSMSYVAAHAAHKRVVDRLADEGERRLTELRGRL